MRRLLIAILTVLCLSPALFAGVARADSTVTVGFDDLANGSTVTTQYEASDGLYFQGSANGSQDGVTPTVVANHAAHWAPNTALINCVGCGELAGPADAREFLDEYAPGSACTSASSTTRRTGSHHQATPRRLS